MGNNETMIIEKISGCIKDTTQLKSKKAFMGVSIYNLFFKKKTMEKYILWASKNFKEFLIILMDNPEKYNLHIFKKINIRLALNKVKNHATELKRCFEKIIQKHNLTNVSILTFDKVKNEKDYLEKLKIINKNYKTNQEFKKDLLDLMNIWIGDKIKNLNRKLSEKELEILSRYIKEELACIIYLTEAGYKIELDPTPEFRTKRKLYEEEFSKIKKQLKLTTRGHIYLHPEGIEKYGINKKKQIEAKLNV